MRGFKFPKLGLRNIKTALSVSICILVFKALGRVDPFYACISAVICMKDTVDNSLTMGKDRLIGTFIGGIIGIIFIYFLRFFPNLNHPNAIIVGAGTIIIIYLLTCINKPGSVSIACVVFIGIMITFTGSESYHYAVNRIIDTAVGVIVAVLVNKYIGSPYECKNSD